MASHLSTASRTVCGHGSNEFQRGVENCLGRRAIGAGRFRADRSSQLNGLVGEMQSPTELLREEHQLLAQELQSEYGEPGD